MEFKIKNNRNLLIAIAFGVLLYWGLNNIGLLVMTIKKCLGILLPFLIGCAIAFILNVPMKHIENVLCKKIKRKSVCRGIGVFLSMILALAIIAFVIAAIIPEMVQTVRQISSGESQLFNDISAWVMSLSDTYPEIAEMIVSLQVDWAELVNKALEVLQSGMTNILSSTVGVATSVIGGVTAVAIGIIFSMYILFNKEKLSVQIKKVMYAYLKEQWVKKILDVARIANQTFAGFISGQCLEAVLFGLLCYIGMNIFRFPYALCISVLIGFTTLIPVVGAFLGTAIGAILIMLTSPLQGIWFIVMIVVLQQIDNNLIYPKIMGNSVGLPGMWVMVAVTLGGSLFGIVGMLVFVPLVSVLYALFRESVNHRLAKKSIKEPL